MARSKKTTAAGVHRQVADKTKQHAVREEWIATAAYYLAERRGFVPGGEVADWLMAEHIYQDQSRAD